MLPIGSTNMADALQAVRDEMFNTAKEDHSGVLNVVIFITDCVSDLNSYLYQLYHNIQPYIATHYYP